MGATTYRYHDMEGNEVIPRQKAIRSCYGKIMLCREIERAEPDIHPMLRSWKVCR
jgi:hypothetical protein